MSEDPVHKAEDGKWYFWDEVWAQRDGPFDTEERARDALAYYCAVELENMPDGCLLVTGEVAI